MASLTKENLQVRERYTKEQSIDIPAEAEMLGAQIRTVVRRHNITDQALHCRRNKYSGMEAPDAPGRLKSLEAENAKLKKIVAEQILVMDALKE